jgi:hypothetical protein
LWFFLTRTAKGDSLTQLANTLDCQRGPLARLRSKLLPRIVQYFGPLPKKSDLRKARRKRRTRKSP